MIATWLIFEAAHGRGPRPLGEATCGLCGAAGAADYEFSSKFMNWDIIRSPALCEACAFCMKEPRLRRSSFLARPDGIRYLKRQELAAALFEPPEPPFVFCVTRTYKKHNAIRAVVATSRSRFPVRMEEELVFFEPQRLRPAYEALRKLYAQGFSRAELACGLPRHAHLRKAGLELWMECNAALAPLRGAPALELLIHTLTKEDRDADK